MNKWLNRILWIVVAAFMAVQTYVAAYLTKPAVEALSGLKDATYVYEGGGFVQGASFMSFLGYLGRITGYAPTYIALHILPFIIIPLSYLSYAFLASSISEDYSRIPAMILVIELLNLYGFQSEALVPFTLLLGWYRGEAILIHLILPLVLALIIRWREAHPKEEKTDTKTTDIYDEEELEEDDEMKHKILNVRNLSIAFAVFVVAAICAMFVLNRKINNLHNATLNLQDVLEQKGEFIEFKGAVGESFKGYIVVDGDNNVTVIFGGGYEDGEALLEVLSRYGNNVTSWYLEKEGEQGAFEYCRENGITIDHIYSIEGIEEL